MANAEAYDLVQFLGRLHPLLVHLPIGFLVLLAIVEVAALLPWFRHVRQARGLVLAVSAVAAAGAVACGWMLSSGPDYDATLLAWHKWTGIAFAAMTLLTALAYWRLRRRFYYAGLTVTLVALVWASHLGGSITHGRDYLTAHAPPFIRAVLGESAPVQPALVQATTPEPKVSEPRQMIAFTELVQPILNQKCVSCHGPEKSKGQLRLDSLAALTSGGKSGPALVAGDPGSSLMVRRLLLPLADSKHMPPEGKPQPSADEVELIRRWIELGASEKTTAAEVIPQPSDSAPPAEPRPLVELQPVIDRLAAQTGLVVTPLEAGGLWLSCNASVAAPFGDEQVAMLQPLAGNIRWLDLAGTRISDAALDHVARMPNLQRLHLQQTAITDQGLKKLTGLRQLAYLNLYGTAITDGGLEHLRKLASLRQVYLWGTQVSEAGARALADALVDRESIRRWEREIEQLRQRIREQAVSVNHGSALLAEIASRPKPINTDCPISGGVIKPGKTVEHEGRLIGFCCDDCIARFQKDPKPALAKLSAATTKPAADPAKPS